MAHSVDVLTKKLEETKIADDIFSGKDLSYEQNFLNAVTEKFSKELEHCEVSTYLSKRSMTICCETFVLTEVTGKELLNGVDRLLDEYFFQADGLHQLGWCSNLCLIKGFLINLKATKLFKKPRLLNFIGLTTPPIDLTNSGTYLR